MRWRVSNRFDAAGAALADRHYTRQTIGSPQFMPSGRALVLVLDGAVWGSSWQVSDAGVAMATHAWPLAWVCSIFRNESDHLSSDLVREAVAATRAEWGEPPKQGFVTFVDAGKVRHKRDPGRCFLRAGWRYAGETTTGKIALELLVEDFPQADAPLGSALTLAGMPDRGVPIHSQRVTMGGEIRPLPGAEA